MARSKYHIKRDDTVKVIAGKDKNTIGRVLKVILDDKAGNAKVVVEGVHKVRRHQKPVADRPGGIIEKELPIHISNVILWNADENRRVKAGYQLDDNGKKVRVDRKTGAELDNA